MTRKGERSSMPNADEMATLLAAVTEVARLAGAVALSHFDQARRSTLAVEFKDDGSPVTAADRAAESTAREWISRHFPADGIVGEELGSVRAEAGRRWLIDPIDGTKSFVRGVPLWGTLIAVAEGESVLAGAIHCAAAGELVSGAIGQGAWWNDTRCAVSRETRLDRATVLATEPVVCGGERLRRPATRTSATRRASADRPSDQERRLQGWRDVAERAAVARTWGDAYGYVLVATGRAEVMVDAVMHPWDAAALGPIIVEAGGVFTDWDGQPTAFGASTIATNAALATEVRDLLQSAGRGERSRR
jgi:histidinol-phosphatase